ncbi:MAG: glucose 1-dehydrogenase, partial [Gemmatimonadetes bacterium]|nr:glucose 1-dehydrogenase [Gemmatimonadota bacterium]
MGTFDGKVAIVTGGAQSMGAATATAFAREGASVAVSDINREAGVDWERRTRDEGLTGLFVEADMGVSADCQRVVNETVAAFGGVDILFNNVGMQPPESYLDAVDTPEELWDRILSVNLKSHFLMSKYSIPHMRERGGGVIINNASVQGLQSQKLVPAYAASKGGILSLTRQMSLDFAADGIRVLAICPGAIDTVLLRTVLRSMGTEDIDAALAEFGKIHPIGRMGSGEDIANAVLFLASDRASFMTGSYVCVDGGLMAGGM